MTPDDLRQVTDAVYYVAHVVKLAVIFLIVTIGVTGWFLIGQRK